MNFEEVSDHVVELVVRWLPLVDVLSLSMTCKRLREVCMRAPLPLLDDQYTSRTASPASFSTHTHGIPHCRTLVNSFFLFNSDVDGGGVGELPVCGSATQIVRWICTEENASAQVENARALSAMWGAFVSGGELAEAVGRVWAMHRELRGNVEALVVALLLPRDNVTVRAMAEDADAMQRIAVLVEYCIARHPAMQSLSLDRIRHAARLACTAPRHLHLPSQESAAIVPALQQQQPSLEECANACAWWDRCEPAVVARALTAFEQRLLFRVAPRELVGAKWRGLRTNSQQQQQQAAIDAINTSLLLRRFNALAQCVAAWVLSRPEPRDRALVIERAVAVAAELRALNNFQQMTAVICALSCASIVRLNATWPLVSHGPRALLNDMQSLCAVDDEYRGLRNAARTAALTGPCLPYLGVLFLTLAHLRGKRMPEKFGTQLMFGKWRICYTVIADLLPFLNTPYHFDVDLDEDAASSLELLSAIPEDHNTLFATSLAREPRVAQQ